MSQRKIIFAMRGTLRDAQRQRIPNAQCPSRRMLEVEVNGSTQLFTVASSEPAFFDDGAFLVEPSTTNQITWNMELDKSVWQKGSNVFIQRDRGVAPDGSYSADMIAWVSGVGNTQKLQRQFSLEPATDYTLTFILQPLDQRCNANDVIRMTGNVIGTPSTSLSQLNDFIGKYRVVTLAFKTAGTKPTIPATNNTQGLFTIVAVTANTFTISGVTSLAQDAMVGGRVQFSGGSNTYNIIGNTAASNGTTVITVGTSTLVSNGVTTSASARLLDAPLQDCQLEFYCETTFSLLWGGAQLEQLPFRTSMIYQTDLQLIRASTLIEFQNRDNPLIDLVNFGIFGDLRMWRGDGNLADFGDIRLEILNSRIRVIAGSTTFSDPDPLPVNPRFYVAVSAESSSVSLFVNGVLKQRVSVPVIRPTAKPLILTSGGVRAWKALVCYGEGLIDGRPDVGGAAQQEVAKLFDPNEPIVGSDMISMPTPAFTLPLITVPGLKTPEVRAKISVVNTTSIFVTVDTLGTLAVNDSVQVVRGDDLTKATLIGWFIIKSFSGNNVTLDQVTGIKVNDLLIKGSYTNPGKAFIRFPFDAIDERPILEVDSGGKRVRVNSSLAFIANVRAIVRTSGYQDVAEPIVRSIDNATGWITLNSVTGIAVGHLIAQVRSETLIPPENYVVSLMSPNSRIKIAEKAQNGVLFSNRGNEEATITPRIEIVT